MGVAGEAAIRASLGVSVRVGVSIAAVSAGVTMASAAPFAAGDSTGVGAAGISGDFATGFCGDKNCTSNQHPANSTTEKIPTKSRHSWDALFCGAVEGRDRSAGNGGGGPDGNGGGAAADCGGVAAVGDAVGATGIGCALNAAFCQSWIAVRSSSNCSSTG